MTIKVPFGLADITIGTTPLAHQADRALFVAEPVYTDIILYDSGRYDKVLTDWNVSLTVVLDEDSYEGVMQTFGGSVEEIVSTTPNQTIGLKDAALFKHMRDHAVEIKIHPQEMGADNSLDVTIFKAVPVSRYERSYGKEKGQWEVIFEALHRTGDPADAGAYFRIGDES